VLSQVLDTGQKAIGILGGAFDPPHIGHLILAQCAAEQLGLCQVLFIPAGVPPYKRQTVVASAEQRLAMINLAIQGNPLFASSDIELQRLGTSYTIDTIRALKAQHDSDTRLYLIVGSDAAKDIKSWKCAQELLESVTVCYAQRANNDALLSTIYPNFIPIKMPAIAISSTELRQILANAGSIRYLVSDRVLAYIRKQSLYGR
jgi:nicotinate-nucleotide adenylyltransferase